MRLTADQVAEIKRRYAAGDSPAFLAGEFGVSKVTIHNAVKRELGKAHGNAKLTLEQAKDVRRRLEAGEWGWAIASDLGVTEQTVSKIKTGKSWSKHFR